MEQLDRAVTLIKRLIDCTACCYKCPGNYEENRKVYLRHKEEAVDLIQEINKDISL